MNDLRLNLAERISCTEAEGPGRRYALWVQGCPLRCPGCCNPGMLEDRVVALFTVEDIKQEIVKAQLLHQIEGVTFIGGEPFAQAEALGMLAEILRQSGLSVMVFSGFTYRQLSQSKDRGTQRLLAATDLLVSGPYVEDQKISNLRWIGSANQEVHFLSERYAELRDSESGWDEGENTIEIRLKGGEIFVNGFPDAHFNALLRSKSKQNALQETGK